MLGVVIHLLKEEMNDGPLLPPKFHLDRFLAYSNWNSTFTGVVKVTFQAKKTPEGNRVRAVGCCVPREMQSC